MLTTVLISNHQIEAAGSDPANDNKINSNSAVVAIEIDRNSGTTIEVNNTIKDTKALVEEYFADAPEMIQIAGCESEYRHYTSNGNVLRGRVDNRDVGVMQINEGYHLETSKKLGINIYTLKGNLDYAKHLYDKKGTQPWVNSKPCWQHKIVALNN